MGFGNFIKKKGKKLLGAGAKVSGKVKDGMNLVAEKTIGVKGSDSSFLEKIDKATDGKSKKAAVPFFPDSPPAPKIVDTVQEKAGNFLSGILSNVDASGLIANTLEAEEVQEAIEDSAAAASKGASSGLVQYLIPAGLIAAVVSVAVWLYRKLFKRKNKK